MLSVSQKKFCADGDASKFENYKWQVPVTVRVQGREGVEPFLLKEKEMEFRLPGVDPNSWIKVHASVACIPPPLVLHCGGVVCFLCILCNAARQFHLWSL